MKLTQRIVQWFSVIALAATSSAALAAPLPQDPINLDQLLQQLEQGKFSQSESNKQREQRFREKEQEQKAMLEDAIAQRNQLEQRAEQLETDFEQNEVDLGNLSDTLTQRMGSLKELFGVLQQVANDASGKFDNSVISAQYPGRSDALEELAENMSSSSKLASIEDIESVWFALQKEMTESGKVAEFTTEVTAANGDKAEQEVVRVGAFNLVSNGKYLERMSSTGSVAELVRQPSGRYLDTAENIQQTDSGIVTFGVDPTGGSILGLLVQAPSLGERIDQGGTVGYIILALGAIGLLFALERFVSLMLLGNKVKRQLKKDKPSQDNPLGRVMLIKDKYPQADTETLELKLSEGILREVPKITRNLTFIKIISVVAPLMGLLGTVTGMINTFQAITLFGTGDPKLMAGGISQALVTTVLGLVVAIPMTLLFATLHTRSKNLIHILQEQASGIIAERSERGE
ncbi:MotA/TolQ/ExbB proton channel family protein [Idiomarina zobellii]|jgi:biopolymer transport protein ExbB|uniref:Energy transducer TonB n=1 Tax=Idiomarina zobellii TaxID=86103 RepID=A0A837NEN0_9GAMM|nr:MotA/TolQ/ExbB proton channel family protein [Idiomarina zobellii]KPD23740.1 energy transducer TonB [Idiomarina zobellii]MCH2455008.1 MotA/TolQ/ExbB proton channel family protein [Idiomarina sp.]SDF88995.1 outer membrane transport energization protein ExbB [Idiomarina zobellii]|tara:strand:- start:738 stop:2117 length:1380 start_codon:yes stop_codon:yes gene_type:complete